MESRMAKAMHRMIETLLKAAAEVSMEKKPPAVRGRMRILLELEAGPLRQVLREGKTRIEQDHRLAEKSQTLMRGRKLPLAGFG
jgi:hypothetical protein